MPHGPYPLEPSHGVADEVPVPLELPREKTAELPELIDRRSSTDRAGAALPDFGDRQSLRPVGFDSPPSLPLPAPDTVPAPSPLDAPSPSSVEPPAPLTTEPYRPVPFHEYPPVATPFWPGAAPLYYDRPNFVWYDAPLRANTYWV